MPAVNLGLESRPAQLQRRIDPMDGVCPPQEKRAVVFGRAILPVRLLPQLNPPQRITTRPQESYLGGGIFRRVVEQADRREHRQAVGEAGLENQVEARLLGVAVYIDGTMPRIGRGGIQDGLGVFALSMADRVAKSA